MTWALNISDCGHLDAKARENGGFLGFRDKVRLTVQTAAAVSSRTLCVSETVGAGQSRR